ncbi:hypothetical protein QFZ66_005672 [Streptomyces sp. B4I13]|nr:hypothetical protein [Streptomyces sp. B4I13]
MPDTNSAVLSGCAKIPSSGNLLLLHQDAREQPQPAEDRDADVVEPLPEHDQEDQVEGQLHPQRPVGTDEVPGRERHLEHREVGEGVADARGLAGAVGQCPPDDDGDDDREPVRGEEPQEPGLHELAGSAVPGGQADHETADDEEQLHTVGAVRGVREDRREQRLGIDAPVRLGRRVHAGEVEYQHRERRYDAQRVQSVEPIAPGLPWRHGSGCVGRVRQGRDLDVGLGHSSSSLCVRTEGGPTARFSASAPLRSPAASPSARPTPARRAYGRHPGRTGPTPRRRPSGAGAGTAPGTRTRTRTAPAAGPGP